MTDPDNPPPSGLNSESATAYGNAPRLVKLTGIFALISTGLSLFAAIYMFILAIFVKEILAHGGVPGGLGTPPLPIWYYVVVYGSLGVLGVCASAVKLIAGIKLLRHGKNAWNWGLASGIINCLELWCSFFCIVPLANGIFTLIVLCKPRVRAYLGGRAVPAAAAPADPFFPE